MRLLLLSMIIFVLAGCAALMMDRDDPASYGCIWVDSHTDNLGNTIEAHYQCAQTLSQSNKARYNCTPVDSYIRTDGTHVTGYLRCQTPRYQRIVQKSYSGGTNCHWVNSYTRKDGTRVRGHRRCR